MDQLAGRQPADPTQAALRNAILQRQAQEELELLGPPDRADQNRQLDRLLADIRRQQPVRPRSWLDKLLDRKPDNGSSAGSMALARPVRWAMAAIGIVVVAVGLRMAMQTQPGSEFDFEPGAPPMLRSGEDPPTIKSQDAERSARHLAAIAAEFSGRPTLYREDQRITVDFEIHPDLRSAMQAKVDGAGLAVQLKDGLNRVVLAP